MADADAVITPWGDARRLRARQLRPGIGNPHARSRNQRERLFAAMVATVARRGYAATRVADLVELSGVSRSSYYEHFDSKQACLLAAVDALTGPTLERSIDDGEVVSDMGRARDAFRALIELVASQPAAAKMCLVEIYAAGPEAVALLDRIFAVLELLASRVLDQIPGREGMPAEIVRAIVGGVQAIICRRLLRGEEDTLVDLEPELWAWIVNVPSPPASLQPSGRRSVRPREFERRQAACSPTDRLLRATAAAVSERGCEGVTVAEIAARAKTSKRTFYASFTDRENAIVAALDSGSAQMLAAALPALRHAPDWPHAVHDIQEAILHFAAEEPEYGRLSAVAIYGAGKRAYEQREAMAENLEELLASDFTLAPDTPRIAPEAIAGALSWMLYDFVRAKGPERLLEMVPTAVYVTLAPFLGAQKAHAVAVGRE